jgi:hypothetical protein
LREQQTTIKQKYREYFDFTEGQITISIHFRLGDYKEKQMYHPILDFEYYSKSVEYISSNINKNQSVVFLYFCEKEDNDYVDKIIEKLRENNNRSITSQSSVTGFIKVDDNIVDWQQLLIMSCCNHQIIANSSFSWFSGYLNNHHDKIVCYPSTWFGPALSHHNLNDLFPSEWIKI